MKKKWLSLASLGFLSALIIVFFVINKKDKITLTEVNMVSSTMGVLEKELTFSSLMEDANAVVVGKVVGTTLLNGEKPALSVKIQEHIYGETDDDTVLVYLDEELVEQDETYVFFLEPFDSPIYDDFFYLNHPEFIIKLEENNQLLRLKDAFEKTYEQPFVETKYNTLTGLKQYIHENIKPKPPYVPIPSEINDLQELMDESDIVAEITIDKIENEGSISVVNYTVLETYKGKLHVEDLLLPSHKIKQNGQYIIFLKKDDGEWLLTTRHNSLVSTNDENYHDYITFVQGQK